MAKFLQSGSGGAPGPGDKAQSKAAGKPASKAATPFGEPATTVRFIRLAKAANDNAAPLGVRLRRWASLLLLIGAAALAVWQFS